MIHGALEGLRSIVVRRVAPRRAPAFAASSAGAASVLVAGADRFPPCAGTRALEGLRPSRAVVGADRRDDGWVGLMVPPSWSPSKPHRLRLAFTVGVWHSELHTKNAVSSGMFCLREAWPRRGLVLCPMSYVLEDRGWCWHSCRTGPEIIFLAPYSEPPTISTSIEDLGLRTSDLGHILFRTKRPAYAVSQRGKGSQRGRRFLSKQRG